MTYKFRIMDFRNVFKIMWIRFSHNKVYVRDNYKSVIFGYNWKLSNGCVLTINKVLILAFSFWIFLNGSSEIKMHLQVLYSLSSTAPTHPVEYWLLSDLFA